MEGNPLSSQPGWVKPKSNNNRCITKATVAVLQTQLKASYKL